jgi:hypothetical protein
MKEVSRDCSRQQPTYPTESAMFFKLPWFSKAKKDNYGDTQVLELDFLVDEFQDAMADIQDPVRVRLHAALISCENPKDFQAPLRERGTEACVASGPEAELLRVAPSGPRARRAALGPHGLAALTACIDIRGFMSSSCPSFVTGFFCIAGSEPCLGVSKILG